MEALREQALNWSLLLQDEKPESAASWKVLHPLLIQRFDKIVNKNAKVQINRRSSAKIDRKFKRLSGSMQEGVVRAAEEAEDKVRVRCRKGGTR
jgi:hypothetical protein